MNATKRVMAFITLAMAAVLITACTNTSVAVIPSMPEASVTQPVTATPTPSPTAVKSTMITSIDVLLEYEGESDPIFFTLSGEDTEFVQNALQGGEQMKGTVTHAPVVHYLYIHYADRNEDGVLWLPYKESRYVFENGAGVQYRLEEGQTAKLQAFLKTASNAKAGKDAKAREKLKSIATDIQKLFEQSGTKVIMDTEGNGYGVIPLYRALLPFADSVWGKGIEYESGFVSWLIFRIKDGMKSDDVAREIPGRNWHYKYLETRGLKEPVFAVYGEYSAIIHATSLEGANKAAGVIQKILEEDD